MGVAGIGLVGRLGAPPPSRALSEPSDAPLSAVVVEAPAAPSTGPRAALGVPYRHAREEGTDGLMGGIPFGLPADTPLVRLDRVNRFTIDDVAVGWSSESGVPPWVRRVGGLPSYVTDPRAR